LVGKKWNLLAKISLFLDSLGIFLIHVISVFNSIDQRKMIILHNMDTCTVKDFWIMDVFKLKPLGDKMIEMVTIWSVKGMLVTKSKILLKKHVVSYNHKVPLHTIRDFLHSRM
jgi:hypothetical protein